MGPGSGPGTLGQKPGNDRGGRHYGDAMNDDTRPRNHMDYHSVVVGGGMAGLTCAAYLAKAGKSVLLLEKNRECGGLVSTFEREGFRFEAGLRALENAGIIRPMLKELGIDLEMVPSPVSVGLEDRIIHIRDLESLDEYRDLLVRFYPESSGAIDRLMVVIRKIMGHMDVLYGVENPNFKDLRSDRAFLFRELLPWLPRFLRTLGQIRRMSGPVESYLEAIVPDPSLRDIIAQHFFKNTPAFFALSYFSLYLDYFYPKGGVGKLAEAVEQKFLELGGHIRRETTITRVEPGRKRVVDANGWSCGYGNLLWAADLKTLYRITDPGGLPGKVRSDLEATRSRFLERRGGDSVFTLYVQADVPPEQFGAIARGHFFYTPSRQGLGDIRWGRLDSLLQDPGEPDKARVMAWLEDFLTRNSYEISIPVLKDPAMAPPGKTGLIVSVLAEYDLFHRLSKTDWYGEFLTRMEDRILELLTATVFPMLENKVVNRFSFSPLSYQKRVGSSEGAITGWSFQEPVPVIHEIQAAGRSVRTPLPSVYQAGQWTYSPAGVPMSILTGKLAAKKMLDPRTARKGARPEGR
ncbi:MAG: NAD(P)/FAD-dependent oxidoreductase [Bacteroidales bacterium]